MRLFRRITAVLAVAAMFAAGLWTSPPAVAVAANNLGLKTIPFRIVNNTGMSGNLFLYVVGLVPSQGNKAYFLSNVNGDLTIVPKAGPPGVSLGLNLGTAGTVTVNLPQLTAARIYFSFGKGLLVQADADGAPPSSPPGWVPTDPNFNTVFDFAEFTWVDDGGPPFVSTLGMNATQVDMFAIPLLLALNGKDDGGNVITRRSGFSSKGAHAKIFGDILRAGKPWSNLILRNNVGTVLRVVSPYLGISPLGVFDATFWDQHITQVWTKYRTATLVGTSEGHTYNATVINGELVFVDQGGGDPNFKFVKPSTETAFRNELKPIGSTPCPPPGPGCRAGAIAALLGAALMRTNLITSTNLNACVVSGFYVTAPINRYAQAFHKYALNHLAYSFGYDDTCEQSSFIQIHDPTMMTITLQKL